MRAKHHYTIYLITESREDTRDNFTISKKVVYETNKRAEADRWLYNHLYLESPLEPFDDGSDWLEIKTLEFVKDY